VIFGALCFAISLFAVPFVGPAAGGLGALSDRWRSIFDGQLARDTGADESCFEKCWAAQQGVVLGVTQSTASLARALGLR
jgi:hypothetical protein